MLYPAELRGPRKRFSRSQSPLQRYSAKLAPMPTGSAERSSAGGDFLHRFRL